MISIIWFAGSGLFAIAVLALIESMRLDELRVISGRLDTLREILFITNARLRSVEDAMKKSNGKEDSSADPTSIPDLYDSNGINKNPSASTEVK